MIRSPLLYLALCSMRNRARVRLRRLREPRYLIGSVVGVAYLSFLVLGRTEGNRSPGPLRMISRGRATVQVGATLMLFTAAMLAWVWPRSRRGSLAFSRAEVQHLFTAPIPRRRLLRYRVLRSQVGVLVGSAITTFFFRPAGLIEGLIAFSGVAILMATTNVHLTGVALSRAGHGARLWVPRAVAAAAFTIVGATLVMHWTDLTAAAAGGGSVTSELERLATTGAAGIVLWPFHAIARLPLAESPRAFLTALPSALVVLALNYLWVLRTDVPFEEASAELSERLGELRRRGAQVLRQPRASARTPFPLASHGRPEMAILWKNLIGMSRMLSWTMLIRVAPLVALVALAVARGRNSTANVLTVACLIVAGFAALLGPQITRSDLRQDLTALAVLKTWPVRGAALVRGEVLAPGIVLIVLTSLALIAAAVLSTGTSFAAGLPYRWSWLGAALLVAPGIVLGQLLVHNGLAVTFPSWVAIGPPRGGVDVIGQRMLVMIAVMLGLVLAVLPAMVVAAVGTGILYAITGSIWPIVPGALAGATLLGEVFAGSEIIGAILDRTDIAAIDAPET